MFAINNRTKNPDYLGKKQQTSELFFTNENSFYYCK